MVEEFSEGEEFGKGGFSRETLLNWFVRLKKTAARVGSLLVCCG